VNFLAVILILALLAVVVLVVLAPLRDGAARGQPGDPAAASQAGAGAAAQPSFAREELDAAREAKYREIRDCELDFRTGKLSRGDYDELDVQLRAEALAILDRIELLGAEEPGASDSGH